MSTISRILKFEFYKLIKHKLFVSAFFIFFILFFAIIISYSYSFPLSNQNELTNIEEENAIVFYTQQKNYYEEIIMFKDGKTNTLPTGTVIDPNIDYQQRFDYYDFLLKTNSFENEYLNHDEQLFTLNHRGSYIMIRILNVLAFILPLLVIIISYYTLNYDFINGSIKNIFASSCDKCSIFTGKLVFQFLLLLIIFVFSISMPIIFGLSDINAKFLLYGTNGYYIQNVFISIFFPKVIAIVLSMYFWANVANFCIYIKNKLISFTLPFLMFAIGQLLFYLLNNVIGIDSLSFILCPLSYMRYGKLYIILKRFSVFSNGWLMELLTAILVISLGAIKHKMCSRKFIRKNCGD